MSRKLCECPLCHRGGLYNNRPKYERDISIYECDVCGEWFYKYDDESDSLVRGPLDRWDVGVVDDILDATCMCNRCGTLFNEDVGLPLLQEFSIQTGGSEYFTGCPNCKSDGFMMDISISDRPSHEYNRNKKSERRGRR